MRPRALWSLLAVGSTFAFFGCKSHADNQVSATPEPSASSAASASASAPPIPLADPAPTSTVQLPEGPVLAIEAGKGVGPIRLGATVATIERLMAAPCEVKTVDSCRYIKRAVEFDLQNGVTDRIVVHRHERPAGPDAKGQPQVYGFFNGGIPPGVGLGMLPSAVKELMGEPLSVEKVTTQNDFDTIQRAFYPGLELEFDRYKNGNVMLGGVIISKAQK
ncbi:MAG TPA: hypothetical protein VGL19_07465 [Polyangiaceae bacterium]|jgi:hypothetical protein